MNAQLRNTLGILSSEVPTGNLVWVDQVNGNDALAVRGRMTIPFQTLGAAKAAASAGDTIVVMPGSYGEKNLLKHQVNWYFMPGAKVAYSGAATGAIFDTTVANGTGGPVTSLIAGHGEFTITAAVSGTSNILNCDATTSALSIQARSMFSANAAIKLSAGTCLIQVLEDVVSSGGDAVLANGGALTVEARDIVSSGGCCLRIQSGSGTVDVVGRKLSSFADHGVSLEGGSGAATIRAYEILTNIASKYPLVYNSTGGSIVTVLGARLKSLWTNVSAYAAYIALAPASSDHKVKLANCVFIGGPTATISLAASTTNTKVHLLNGAAANVAFSNITPVGAPAGTPFVDTNIS